MYSHIGTPTPYRIIVICYLVSMGNYLHEYFVESTSHPLSEFNLCKSHVLWCASRSPGDPVPAARIVIHPVQVAMKTVIIPPGTLAHNSAVSAPTIVVVVSSREPLVVVIGERVGRIPGEAANRQSVLIGCWSNFEWTGKKATACQRSTNLSFWASILGITLPLLIYNSYRLFANGTVQKG